MNNMNSLQVPEITLTGEQITDLARALLPIVQKYYQDPEHLKEFEEWMKNREKEFADSEEN